MSISLSGSAGNRATGSTLTGNGFSGFVGDGSDNNTLTGNTAIDNEEWGFFVDAVLANMFQDNVCSGNGLGGSNQPDIC